MQGGVSVTGYYRVMLGRSSAFVDECVSGGFIGADFDIDQDLCSRTLKMTTNGH